MIATLTLVACALLTVQDRRMEEDFRKALAEASETKLTEVCRALVLQGSAANAKLILSAIPVTQRMVDESDMYWLIVRSAAAFQTSHGLEEVARHILDKRKASEARDLAAALHNNFTPACEEALVTVLEGAGPETDLRVSALDHLLEIGGRRAAEGVIELMRKEARLAPEVSHRAFNLLRRVLKQDLGDSAANWVGWWDANKDKPWQERANATGERPKVTDRLKGARVLIIRAGKACKCGRNHDLDPGIDAIMTGQAWTTESITKKDLDSESITPASLLRDYIGIIAICTHIREHCGCPNCKPGAEKGGPRLVKCVGCGVHENVTFRLSKNATAKIKAYVDAGGYLFAEDWAMEDLIEPEWSALVRHSKFLDEQEVQVLPPPGMGNHPYLRRIFVRPPQRKDTEKTDVEEDVSLLNYTYKIDAEAPAIAIADKRKVTVLMFSETLKSQTERDGGSDAVTVTWESGTGGRADGAVETGAVTPGLKGGRVIYTLAHFGKQPRTAGGAKGDYALQNLLINFLVESHERRLQRGR